MDRQGMLKGTHVLVVGSDALTRDVLAALLGYVGAFVSDAISVPDSLGVLERNRPHVVVADFEIADEAAAELVARIRSLAGTIPIVALVAGGDERNLRDGFAARLRKPVDPWAFCRLLTELAQQP